jgi:hypothetical protein
MMQIVTGNHPAVTGTQRRAVSIWVQILNAIIGLILMAFGGYFLWMEMKTPPTHSAHVYFFAAIAILGALVIRPDPLFAVIKQVFIIAGPYIPVIGGRRIGDPPAPPSEPPANPPPPTGG